LLDLETIMFRARRLSSAILGILLLAASSGCVHYRAPQRETQPLAVGRMVIMAPDVAVTSAKPAKRVELKRQLLAEVDKSLGGRAQRFEASTHADADRALRIAVAHAKSTNLAYGELAPADVRGLAEQSGADAIVITRLEGDDTSTSQQVVQAATAFVGHAALGVVTMSPSRLIGAALSAAETSRTTSLRVTVVDASGEVVWASSVSDKSAPSSEVVSELVAQAFSTFPRLVDSAPALASLR
jgi:hypothetical protein